MHSTTLSPVYIQASVSLGLDLRDVISWTCKMIPRHGKLDSFNFRGTMCLIRNRSLYIQALTALQNMDENDQLSYFQIAGIHGRPFIPWNGVSQIPGSGWGGYCTHSKR